MAASRKTFHTLTTSIAAILLAAALPALAAPEMDLQQPLGTSVPDGGSRDFGTVEYGNSAALLFTILNTGTTALTLTGNPRVSISGANAADFTVTTQPASPVPAGGVTVQNPGFETPVQETNGLGYTYQPSGAGWTFGSSTGISRNGTIWYANPAPQGTQAGFLFGTGAVISQAFNFPAPGNYLVRLSATNRRDYPAGQIRVAMDGTSLGDVLTGAPTDGVWRSFVVPYTCPAAGSHTLSLTIVTGGVSVVDDVQITTSSFQVVFTPSAGGTRTAMLSIANDDSNENPYNVTLTGTVPLRSLIQLDQPAGTPLMTGKVAAWGFGNNGELNVPPTLSSVKAIAAGARSTQALRYDGTLAAWGDIIAPAGLSNLVAIESGEAHSLALRSDGTVITWGSNSNDQQMIPAGLTGVMAITAGDVSSAALKSDGSTVVSWGYSVGQPPALATVVGIARGSTHTLALRSNGTVVAWGENFRGEANVPPGLAGVVQIAAGGYRSIAVKGDGTVVSWGGSFAPPAGLAGVVAIAVSPGHGLALKSDGTITPWGDNTYGQASVPAGVVGVRAVAANADLSDATQGHSVALLDSTVDFGAQATSGSSAPKTFTIRNAGTAPLAISGVSVTGPDAARFSVSTAGMATTVPALGGQTTFSVTFTPGTLGAKHATLRVANNDGTTGPFFVHLTGNGAGAPVTPTAVVSRKLHNNVPYDINLPLTGTPGVECRSGGASNAYQLVLSFATPVTYSSAAVTSGTGSISSSSGTGTNTVTLNLSGVTNAQRITVTLGSVNNGTVINNVPVTMGVLIGDGNGDGLVNSGDAIFTRNRSGQAADATNFRADYNLDGTINSGDAIVVRGRSGTSLP